MKDHRVGVIEGGGTGSEEDEVDGCHLINIEGAERNAPRTSLQPYRFLAWTIAS